MSILILNFDEICQPTDYVDNDSWLNNIDTNLNNSNEWTNEYFILPIIYLFSDLILKNYPATSTQYTALIHSKCLLPKHTH